MNCLVSTTGSSVSFISPQRTTVPALAPRVTPAVDVCWLDFRHILPLCPVRKYGECLVRLSLIPERYRREVEREHICVSVFDARAQRARKMNGIGQEEAIGVRPSHPAQFTRHAGVAEKRVLVDFVRAPR